MVRGGKQAGDYSVAGPGGERGMGPEHWRVMSSYRRDRSVVAKKLAPGTVRRVLRFALPYRRELSIFLVTVVLDALIGVATPILAGRVINQIAGGHGSGGTIVKIALAIALLAVVDSGLSLVQRWYSSRIGEGLIFDLRTRVY